MSVSSRVIAFAAIFTLCNVAIWYLFSVEVEVDLGKDCNQTTTIIEYVSNCTNPIQQIDLSSLNYSTSSNNTQPPSTPTSTTSTPTSTPSSTQPALNKNIYSSRECKHFGKTKYMSCMLHNVCYFKSNVFLYFVPDENLDGQPMFTDENFRVAGRSFDKEQDPAPPFSFVQFYANESETLFLQKYNFQRPLPKVLQPHVPPNNHEVTYRRFTSVLTDNLYPLHWGHFLMDLVTPTASLMVDWGLADTSHHLVVISDNTFYHYSDYTPIEREGKWNLISKRPMARLNPTPDKLVCYENLLVGAGGRTGLTRSPIPESVLHDVHLMRDFIFRNMDIETVPRRENPLIIFTERPNTNRKLFNQADIIAKMKENNYNVELVKLEDYTVKQQIEMVNRAGIIVGTSGTGLHQNLFLPDYGSVIEIVPLSHYSVTVNICNGAPRMYCSIIVVKKYHWAAQPERDKLPSEEQIKLLNRDSNSQGILEWEDLKIELDKAIDFWHKKQDKTEYPELAVGKNK